MNAPLSRRIGASRSSKPSVGQAGGDLGAEAEGREGLVDDQQPAGLGDRLEDGVEIERGDCPRIDELDRDVLGGELLADLQRVMDHQRQGDDRDVAAFANDGGLAKVDLVIVGWNGPFDVQELAVFQKDDRLAAPERLFHEPLGVVRRRRDRDAQPGKMSVHGIVIARVVRGRRMADADAAAEQDGHREPAVAHVLDLGDLVDDLADGVEDEIGEHEVDDRARAGHGGPAAEADEPAFADRRIAEANGTVEVVKPGRGLEVSAAFADAFAHDEDRRVAGHFFGQGFERGLHVSDLARGIGRSR